MAEMDKIMQDIFSGSFGGPPGENGAPPDIANLAKLIGQFGGPEEGSGEVGDDKVEEAQKLFQECLQNIQKETDEATKEEDGKPKPDMSDPKGEGLGNLGEMFKNFEKIAKESEQKTDAPTDGQKPAEDPFAKLFANMGQPGGPDKEMSED